MNKALVLHAGEGIPIQYGADFLVKIGERKHGRGVAIVQLTTRHGEEPPEHTHDTEDEIFYVLQGTITFDVANQQHTVASGGMIVLPCGIPHTYAIADGEEVSLLIITHPVYDRPEGWGGFVADMESLTI